MTQQHANAGLGRHLGRLALAAAVAATAACGAEGGRDDYAKDGDTGAAAPAVEGGGYDQSTAKMIGPDSSLGTQGRSGTPGVAGDTTGERGMPAGRTDSAARSTAQPRGTRPPPPR